MLTDLPVGVGLIQTNDLIGECGAGQFQHQPWPQGPGGIAFVADDQVQAHVVAPFITIHTQVAAQRPVRLTPESARIVGDSASMPTAGTPDKYRLSAYLAASLKRPCQVRYSALIFTYSWDRSVVQIVSLQSPRPSSIRMVISSSAITALPCASV